MADSETEVNQELEVSGDTTVDELLQQFGNSYPYDGVEKSSAETYSVTLSYANWDRVSRALVLAATRVLQEDPEIGGHAASECLGLRSEINRQIRAERVGEQDE